MSHNPLIQAALDSMFLAFVQDLNKRLASGDPISAAELNVIRQTLKDNNITALPAPGSPLGKLASAQLPTFPPDDGLPADDNESAPTTQH
jgi:hypothetical protein